MKIKGLVGKLRNVEGIDSSVLDKIIAAADELEASAVEAKNATVASQKKNTALEGAVLAIAGTLGIEGELEQIVGEVASKASTTLKAATTLAEEKETLTAQLTEATDKATKLERAGAMRKYADVGGLEEPVFIRLMSGYYDEMKIDGEALMIGDKPVTDFVESTPDLAMFKDSLFKAKQEPQKPASTLPSGSPRSGDDKPDSVMQYIQKTYLKSA